MTGSNPPFDACDDARPDHAGPAELAALFLSGAMTSVEREDFESRLAAGDSECAEEVRRLQAAAEALVQQIAPVQPPAEALTRVMRAVEQAERASHGQAHQQIWRQWTSDAEHPLFTLRAGEGDWQDTGVSGVQVRRLFVDRPANRMTAMFRMAAGSQYPEHVHDGPEECYVLEGDLHVGDELIMRSGDYQRALPGSEHGRQWTEGGCLLLVTCSLTDEVV